jgi:hypothetical protein
MNSRLLTSAITAALVIAGCSGAPSTNPATSSAQIPGTTAEEQAFLASSASTVRYQRMIAQVGADVDVDVEATTTVVPSVVNLPGMTPAMAAHAAMVKLGATASASSTRNSWFRLD